MCDKKTPVDQPEKEASSIEERHAWATPDAEHDPELHKHLQAQGRPLNHIWPHEGD